MIEAIIFDCFGVLATEGLLPFCEKCFGSSAELMQKARELDRHTNAGLISYGDFVHGLGQLAHISDEEVRRQIEPNVPNAALFGYIKTTLKLNYKIGMLSNAAADWLTDIFESSQLELFDATVLSYQTGFIKPEPQAYEIAADRLGVQLNECVMVDDREDYCLGAQGVGMRAIQYENLEQLKRELDAILVGNES